MDSLGEGRYCGTLAFTRLAQWTAGTNGVPRYRRMQVCRCSLLLQATGTTLFVRTVQYRQHGAACAVGSKAGCQKKTNRANLNCAPCSVDTRLGRPAYHGRLSPAMREKMRELPSSLGLFPPQARPRRGFAHGAPLLLVA